MERGLGEYEALRTPAATESQGPLDPGFVFI